MQCLTPITLYRKEGSKVGKLRSLAANRASIYTDVVPCGKCVACLKRRQFNWVFRLQQEQQVADSAAFLTLTYDEEHLPKTEKGLATLDKTHHQAFIKRLRKQVNSYYRKASRQPIRYYSCGEYGETNSRPHFHSIMFNLPGDYIRHPELVTNVWGNGSTMVAECNIKTITYVTKYMQKTLFTQGKAPDDDRIDECSMMSRGIGLSYLGEVEYSYDMELEGDKPKIRRRNYLHKNQRKDWIKYQRNPYLIVENGDKIPIPRFYKDKIFNAWEKFLLSEKAEKHIRENPEYIDAKHREDVTVYHIEKNARMLKIRDQKRKL